MVVFFVLSLIFIGAVSAEGLGFGAKGGFNMAKFSGEDASFLDMDPKSKLGVIIGGFVTFPLGDKLTIRPEVLLTQKGARYKDSDFKEIYKMNWLDIPILAVYQVAGAISVFVGPYFDIYLGGEAEYEFTEFKGDEKIEGEDVNSLGFGLIFGGAYGVTDNIEVEARAALGLTSWHDEETVKNMGIQVLANYYLKK